MSSLRRCGAFLVRRRLLDVLLLQGSPALGAVLATGRPDPSLLPPLALLLAGSTLLVAHVFSFNDWADAALDAEAPRKAGRSFLTLGIARGQMLACSAVLGAAALAALAPLPLPVPLFGAGVLAAGLAYSAPRFGLKRAPVLSSLVHTVGQGAHFLMGYALVAAPDARGLRLALFFALVFTAGHLNQEVRDHEGDVASGVRTNAVVFGRRAAFFASGALFAASFACLAWLASTGDLPPRAGWLTALFAVYAVAFGRAVRGGVAFGDVTRLQAIYRGLFVAVGIALVTLQLARATAAPGRPGPSRDDPFGMAGRCPWYAAGNLNFQWTLYMVTGDDRLLYVGFAPRLHDPDGRPFAGVNVVLLEGNREVTGFWNRFPIEAAHVADTDVDVTIGKNRLSKGDASGRARYAVHLELEDGGRPFVLDATMDRTLGPCRPGGFQLLSWEETGNHVEYEVPCLGAALSGTLDALGRRTRLSGSGYVESLRWLRSRMDRPAHWFWGYLHAGGRGVLFFRPEGYPRARSLLLLADGAGCTAIEDAPLRVTPPAPGRAESRVEYRGDGVDLSLGIDTGVRRSGGFPIFLAPYELELRRGSDAYSGAGTMVFEAGLWSAF